MKNMFVVLAIGFPLCQYGKDYSMGAEGPSEPE
jgi:hypothetical protein